MRVCVCVCVLALQRITNLEAQLLRFLKSHCDVTFHVRNDGGGGGMPELLNHAGFPIVSHILFFCFWCSDLAVFSRNTQQQVSDQAPWNSVWGRENVMKNIFFYWSCLKAF